MLKKGGAIWDCEFGVVDEDFSNYLIRNSDLGAISVDVEGLELLSCMV